MTGNKVLIWSMWALTIMTMLITTACGNNEPTVPNPSDVKDSSPTGKIGEIQLSSLMNNYQQLRNYGGGVKAVDAEGYSLIAAFNRWSKEDLTFTAIIQEANEQVSAFTSTNGLLILNDLTFPITVSVIASGYVNQTIIKTNANVIVFGLEPFGINGDKAVLFGLALPDYNIELSPGWKNSPWATISMNTQDPRYSKIVYGNSNYIPYSFVEINPWKPMGAVTWLFLLEKDNLIPSPNYTPLTIDDYTCVAYAYDDLGFAFPGVAGSYMIDFDPVDELIKYTNGVITIDPEKMNGFEPPHDITTYVVGGTCLADTWEFVPSTLPCRAVLTNGEGIYEVKGIIPKVIGARDAICSIVEYGDGGSEVKFANWNPQSTSLPPINFGMTPKLKEISYSSSDYGIAAEWESNNSEAGLLVLSFSYNGSQAWSVIVDGGATGLTNDLVKVIPGVTTMLGSLKARLIRIDCSKININDFDVSTIWSETEAFSSSASRRVTPYVALL